jgi:hypothetical protein
MSRLNLLFFIKNYQDCASTNAPKRGVVERTVDFNGLCCGDQGFGRELELQAGETKELFNGVRTLFQDNTTQYSVALKPMTTTTYVLSWSGGVAPNFRTPRVTGADATTQTTVTINGPLATFTSTGGTPLNLIAGGVGVGDQVVVGTDFAPSNQGLFVVSAVTPTSFTVENLIAGPEGPITLGADFADQIQIFSASGVQKGDVVSITSGLSPVSWGNYNVLAVYANALEFGSTGVLPQEGPVTTEVNVYSNAKQLTYVEADGRCELTINGVAAGEVEPWVVRNHTKPGIFVRKSTQWQMAVTNPGLRTIKLFVAAVD